MIKDALYSLKNDFDRTLFYWIVFVLSAMFMFMFFHLSLSQVVGVTFLNSKNDIPTYLTVFVIAICMVAIFMANDFYVKKKSKELATILVCGGSYLQLVQFIMIQTGIIMLLSIPLGLFLGYLCFPLLNILLSYFHQSQIFMSINGQAILSIIIVMSFEILWCTLLNLGYAYRNSIQSLMHGEAKIKVGKFSFEFNVSISRYLYLIIYIGCIILLYLNGDNTGSIVFIGIGGLIGINGCIKRIILPFINQYIKDKCIDNHEKIVYIGFFREDLKIMKTYIFILISTSIILLAMLALSVNQSIEMTLCLISYTVMNCLLSLSLMFRYSTEINGRKNFFSSLEKIGYLKKQLKSIMMKEIMTLYGFILLVSMVYILNIAIVLYIHHYISSFIVFIISIIFICPLIICGIINYFYYIKLIK